MQAKYRIALALAAGFALGAGAIHGLHAAASPPAYVINEITVKDEDVGRCPRCAREDRQQVRDFPHLRSGRRGAILNAPNPSRGASSC